MNRAIKLCLAIGFCWSLNGSEIVDLTILQTTDLHAQIQISPSKTGRSAMLSVATVVREQRALTGAGEGLLLIDCGDTLQGSFIGAATRGRIGIAYLNALRYDAWIPGNHDLDFGVQNFVQLLDSCRVPVLNGNVSIYGESLPAYKILEKNDVTVAVIGLNARALFDWLWGDNMDGVSVRDGAATLEKIMPEVTAQEPDMIIVALHQGYSEQDPRRINEVKEIAYRFPQIDLILGGHTHREFPGRRIGRVWYVQAGSHGEYVARIDARVDVSKHEVVEINSRLLPVADVDPDSDLATVLALQWGDTDASGEGTIVRIDSAVTSSGTPGVDCQMAELLCRAIAWKTGVSVVVHGKLSNATWREGKDLTERLLFDAVPYENGIAVADLTMKELTLIIEEQLGYRKHRSFNGVLGVEAVIDLPSQRVLELRIPGIDRVAEETRLPVAFNSYVIAGGGRRCPILRRIVRTAGANLRDTRLITRDVVREYLSSSDAWKQPPKRWFESN